MLSSFPRRQSDYRHYSAAAIESRAHSGGIHGAGAHAAQFCGRCQCQGRVAVFLAFRQRLANLEPLRPLPLVLSVHWSDPFGVNNSGLLLRSSSSSSPRNAISSRRRLNAYYCTGGTVVVSDVGRFHIMDRSTHSLLSPSSISNRMSLIELSRRRTTMTTTTTTSDAKQQTTSLLNCRGGVLR